MARKRATLTDLLNDLTFRVIYDKFKLLATSCFEWEGLPDTVDPKYLERYLFDYGKAIFFRDPGMSYMCLRADDTGKVNVYGEPLSYHATGFQYHREYSTDQAVIIENNPLRIATESIVMMYVNKLTEAERTMDTNIKKVKIPWVFACDENDVLTVKQLFRKIDGNEPCIIADKRLNLDSLNVFKTESRFLCNELMDYSRSVENELLTFLGINNVAIDKKERVNVDETNSNNEIINSFADIQLTSRELACERINEMFKLNVSVKRREVLNNGEQSLFNNESDVGAQGDSRKRD